MCKAKGKVPFAKIQKGDLGNMTWKVFTIYGIESIINIASIVYNGRLNSSKAL